MAIDVFIRRQAFVSAESLAMGAAAESIATAGGTIPGNVGGIYFFVPSGDNVHFTYEGGPDPTSTTGHAVAASQWGFIPAGKTASKIISDDGSDVTLIIVYERGSGRPDNGGSVSEPR